MADMDQISRRDMLKRSLVVIGAAASAGSVLAACGDDDDSSGGAPTCDAADDAQRTARSGLQYVAESPDPEKNCLNCQLWQGGQDESQCGTCQVLQGPIHPMGYCASWVITQS